MFTQVKLPYEFNALEPHIDAQTMEIHYSRHHATYTNNLNDTLKANSPACLERSIEDIFAHLNEVPESIRMAVRNNGGGFYNHNLYFSIMTPNAGGEPTGELAKKIAEDFGSFDKLKEELSKAAATRFGSGWAWLIVSEGKLKVVSTPNQDNPLMELPHCKPTEKGTPILGIDVWEHAYYLKYQNKRPDYVAAFFNVVNWDAVAKLYEAAK